MHNVSMPKCYCSEDATWIQGMLLQLPSSARNRALVAYADVYQRYWDEEPVSYRKDNSARHGANTRLRRFVRRLSRTVQGYTSKPLKAAQ